MIPCVNIGLGKDEPWTKPRKCGIHLVYNKQDLGHSGDKGSAGEVCNDNIKRSRNDEQLNPAEEPHPKRLKQPNLDLSHS